ncbi:MAG TPA: hypothetical protein VI776_06690 [Anaerolineales bacterium]|nr:hypothetical protein [Anaerolineales bacterium]
MNTKKTTPILLLLLAMLACNLPGWPASPPPGAPVGLLTRLLDQVEKGAGEAALSPVSGTQPLLAGDRVRVSQGGEGLLDYGEQLRLRLFNDTSTNLVEAASAPGAPLSVRLFLERGGMTGRMDSPGGSFQVKTPGGAQILVLGTQFFAVYDPATRITWVGNFDGLLGVAAGGALSPVPSDYYLMVPAGEKPGPPLPLPFTLDQFDSRARQLGSASAALARLALAGRSDGAQDSASSGIPQPPTPVISPVVTAVLPGSNTTATQAPTPAQETPSQEGQTSDSRPLPQPTRDRLPPRITLLPPSTEPVGVGLTCLPGAGIVRLKADVWDPGGVAAVTAFWSLGDQGNAVALRRNAKGNYIAEIGPLEAPGTMRVTLSAVDGAGNLGSTPSFEVVVSTCPDIRTPVIGALELNPELAPTGQVCAGTPTPLLLTAKVTDDGPLQRVTAFWEAGGVSRTASMEPQGDDRYQANLVLESQPGEVPVRIEALDAAGNRAASGSTPIRVVDCRPVDQLPVIEAVDVEPGTISAGKSCPSLPVVTRLTARATDDRRVERVTARWQLGDATGEAPLEPQDGDTYQVELGPFETPGLLAIEISAFDDAGQPAAPQAARVKVTGCPDGEAPRIELVSLEPVEVVVESGCTDPKEVTVTARVKDDSPIREVLATWQLGDARREVAMAGEDQGLYRATLGPFPIVGKLSITLYAWDEAGNEALAKADPVEVFECFAEP